MPTKEHPILFKSEMVRAILEGRKSQTRRIVKAPKNGALIYDLSNAVIDGPSPFSTGEYLRVPFRHRNDRDDGCQERVYPKWRDGDRLWVKETFRIHSPKNPYFEYRATDIGINGPWKPSIFMPRSASRLDLESTKIRVERLRDISESDAIAEGVASREDYRELWNSISLKPKAIYEPEIEIIQDTNGHDPIKIKFNGKKEIVSYESYPWSNEDFDAKHPGARYEGIYRGKPLTVIENPWVWVIEFKKV